MDDRISNVVYGALLHDVGKIIFRANEDSRRHSISGAEFVQRFTDNKDIIESVKYHHKGDLKSSRIRGDSPAFIVYIADNIAAGIDRREIEGEEKPERPFNKDANLSSVFNLFNGNKGKMEYEIDFLGDSGRINYPGERRENSKNEAFYKEVFHKLRDTLGSIEFTGKYINSLMEICESHMSYIPSSTAQGEVADISLYDHQKITAALASSIYRYMSDTGISDFREHLLKKEREFYDEQAFLMVSLDISGIQKFIYTISSKGALKSLRSRSFYLEIMMEHIVDEILDECGLSRASLIYTGGGHAYLLMPNTRDIVSNLETAKKAVNSWLMERFGVALYLGVVSCACSANDLMNKSKEKDAYQNIFKSLARSMSLEKMRRYAFEDIMKLNEMQKAGSEGRECSVCGSADRLQESMNGMEMCSTCKSIYEISNLLVKDDVIFVSAEEKLDGTAFEMPLVSGGTGYIHAYSAENARKLLKQRCAVIKNIYGKNKMYTGGMLSTKLWMGDYSVAGEHGMATFEELACDSEGIERIAVLRADVDNLGRAFVSGFERENGEEKNRYVTISRTATLSRQLSMFFKYYINNILRGELGEGIEQFSLSGSGQSGQRRATIVYSGGDDVFVVGAWNEAIELAVDMRRAFERFCSGTLTISAGIPIFQKSYPMARMASEAGRLEDEAKEMPGKASVSLFGFDSADGAPVQRHTYAWETFENQVVGEKLRLLQENILCIEAEQGDQVRGKAFLYNMMNLLKEAENDRINIARYAYTLARLAPGRGSDEADRDRYRRFSEKMYSWILSGEDRKQLITAITLFVYLLRGKSEN